MFDKNKVKLGIAPIAWTNDDLPDLGKISDLLVHLIQDQCVHKNSGSSFLSY